MTKAAARPVVSVYDVTDSNKALSTVALPDVLLCPIRPDIVRHVHTQIRKNNRQAYSVKFEAGMQTAAESWGTGRAVSRIPRVPGGGTHRAGQGAFGNMCRGGRMFAPTKIWRKWHRKIATNQRRYAVVSALAASAVPALVSAKGHRVSRIPELPLVLEFKQDISKTKEAMKILQEFGIGEDIERVKLSKKIRAGRGKARNRRYVAKKGPLIIHAKDNKMSGLILAFKGIPGVELAHVDRLNLLQLAPGGHVGRLVVWTKAAFERLNTVFGTFASTSEQKKNFVLPKSLMLNSDISRVINSDVVQTVIKDQQEQQFVPPRKINPLRNAAVMQKLNPYANTLKRKGFGDAANETQRAKQRKENIEEKKKNSSKAVRKAFYKNMTAE